MSVTHLRTVFDGYEYDTQAMRSRTLEALEALREHCTTDADRKLLQMATDVVARLELKEYA